MKISPVMSWCVFILVLSWLTCSCSGWDVSSFFPVEDFSLPRVLNRIAQGVNTNRNSTWTANRRMDARTILAPLWALTGSRPNDPYRFLMPMRRRKAVDRLAVPVNFDSRTQWSFCPTIGEIYQQGRCASCWAIAPADVMSDRICIHSKGKRIVRLSAGNLLSCCRRCGRGCNGGFPGGAWYHWLNRGVVTGGFHFSDYGCQKYPVEPCAVVGQFWKICPQKGSTPKCTRQCDEDADEEYEEDLYYGQSIYRLPRKVREIQMEIMTNGPVQATFRIYEDFLTYRSGIYQHLQGRALDYHAVRIIGWGEEEGTPYWLCANIWGERWGEGGFFRILRGQNHVEIESNIMAGIPRIYPEGTDDYQDEQDNTVDRSSIDYIDEWETL